ncbi:MAG: 2-C-methyl-D-erythritol 4-phosphate cytidylyltransferase [Actinomycetes bacterium]
MTNTTRTAVCVPAAGRGERLGPGSPKALRDLGGTPILVHSVRAMSRARGVDLVVVAAPADQVDQVRALLAGTVEDAAVTVVSGGDTRQESVARSLLALPADVDIVLVHDAARPLVPVEVIERVIHAVRGGHRAVVPVVAVVDTVKQVDAEGVVIATPDRVQLRAVQTPQGFDRETLQQAHATAEVDDVSDDAGLVERLGIDVWTVPGHEEGFKITRPLDLVLAEAILSRRRARGDIT